jgi:VWFA-related protein
MLLGNTSLEMVQGFTRSKADLLSALNHVPPALPYKMNPSFFFERFAQSVDALQQIALQNTGVPGRKNIIWVGHGGPSINTMYLAPSDTTELNRYVHDTTNLMVNARVSLFLIYPGLPVNGPDLTMSEESADADIGETDPFAGDINFGVFVNETGGNLFYNRNDVDAEIQRSRILGSQYYTLTYQPPPSEWQFSPCPRNHAKSRPARHHQGRILRPGRRCPHRHPAEGYRRYRRSRALHRAIQSPQPGN